MINLKDEALLKKELQIEINNILQIAFTNIKNGNIDQAKRLYLNIIDIIPLHAEANHSAGIIELNANSALTALPRLEIAIQSDPHNEQYWISYIEALIIIKDFTTAKLELRNALEFSLRIELAATLSEKIQKKNLETKSLSGNLNNSALPRITTLIPAYKPAFILETLLALTSQTYPFIDVIVSDDSLDQEITQLINSPTCEQIRRKLNLKILRGPGQGGMSNILHLLGHCNDASLIHVLMDDDLIYPKFYEQHVKAHIQKNISVSVSYRWFCNQYGQPMGVSAIPAWINTEKELLITVDSAKLFDSVIPNCDNWLGEFSNAVFKPSAIRLYARSRLENIAYYGLGDIGALLESSLQGDLAIIKEYLGAFRQHDTQYSSQQNSKVFQCGVIAWVALALGAYRAQKINAEILQLVVLRIGKILEQRYPNDPQIKVFIRCFSMNQASSAEFDLDFNRYWEAFILCQDWQAAQSSKGQQQHAL